MEVGSPVWAVRGRVEQGEYLNMWGYCIAEYQSPSRVGGVCLQNHCLEWVSESEYVEIGIHMGWGQSRVL